MEELTQIIRELSKKVENLERLIDITNLVIPANGKLVVDKRSVDPTAENGKIYYNTTANKYKVCENGLWRTITTT